MKAWIWKWVQRWFEYEIKQREDAFHAMKAKQRENDKVTLNYPKGTKVIIRTNEPGPLLVGHVTDYFPDKRGNIYAIGITQADGSHFMTLNTSPAYYHPAIVEALSKLEWNEQWNVLSSRGLVIIDPKEKERKEGYTYGGTDLSAKDEVTEIQKQTSYLFDSDEHWIDPEPDERPCILCDQGIEHANCDAG